VSGSSDKPRVLKFGGTSVGSAERIRGVVEIVAERAAAHRVVVVVSAMGGVTSQLVAAADAAAAREAGAEAVADAILTRHLEAAAELADPAELEEVSAALKAWAADVRSLIHGISLVRHCSPRVMDAVMAHGELMSSVVVAAALRRAAVRSTAVDTRALVVTDDSFGHAVVDRAATDPRLREGLSTDGFVPVVTGFIGATPDGTTTTLGRGGSDYTGTLVGAALDADVVEIWTDVDGVMSADPRLVPQAFPLARLTYTELMELSHFGAKVVFPPAVSPARERGLPVVIRNTLKPSFPGTWVLPGNAVSQAPAEVLESGRRQGPVRGVSSISRIALCRLQGAGMVGVPGIASRLFGTLARDGISVILISQASSEHSICFALEPSTAERARRRVDTEFTVERQAGVVDPLVVEHDCSVVAVVGEAMRESPGIAGRLFDVLGRNGINVHAISQGSSELNISLVVHREDEERAVRLVHEAFFLPRTRTVQVFVAGTGRVGAELLDQIAKESERLGERVGVRVLVSGIGRSRGARLARGGIPLATWRNELEGATEPPGALIDAALRSPNAHKVFVDCTASPDAAAAYEELLRNGVSIVSANKIAFSESLARYRGLRRAARLGNGMFIETTVGAGLPVLRPIADLVATGDVVARIEGVFSGTVSFLFARLREGVRFSEAVRDAWERGFTEPDPREDLSGRDVARKLLILAREAGFEIEPEDVRVDPVLGGVEWAAMTLQAFWDALPSADAYFEERRREAAAKGQVLSYLAGVDPQGAQVGLQEVEARHPSAALSPGDNLIIVSSQRYADRPLIIRGPGAGPDVTAAGVFADIIRAGVESL
jgi:aspartokinase/homoserine dehydrogenase 1